MFLSLVRPDRISSPITSRAAVTCGLAESVAAMIIPLGRSKLPLLACHRMSYRCKPPGSARFACAPRPGWCILDEHETDQATRAQSRAGGGLLHRYLCSYRIHFLPLISALCLAQFDDAPAGYGRGLGAELEIGIRSPRLHRPAGGFLCRRRRGLALGGAWQPDQAVSLWQCHSRGDRARRGELRPRRRGQRRSDRFAAGPDLWRDRMLSVSEYRTAA